ncbi:FimV/HubP family polar landmark protein [Pandoraea cepalis]|uniref:Peptidoglycan-binding LysM n=1 Tax=Pandoraea cepalis TaxID=2508294 RepID=A0A5E4UWA4_9BURK|nr:FimV/HubP family polar landmark protein [Pandoraea cepalis]VVE04186.1 peptidoglycan-binding LysM [Pandoraea cepalis]
MRKYSIGKRANSSRNAFRLSAAAAVLWSLGLLNAGAAEFGPQQVRSGPGQPLRAVIVLGNVSQAEADGLSVKLAPRDAFKQAGLRYDPTLEKLSVSVSPTAGRAPGYSGTYLVHVDSAEPISTSFLDLLLVLEWRTGRQSNAVTLSAIPEASATQAQAVVPAAAASQAPPAASPASTAPALSTSASATSAQPGKASAVGVGGERKVGHGESLSSIAREFTGGEGGVTLAQMMSALFEANRSAFIGNDPNRLRQGATLTRPSDAQVQGIPPAQARKFVSAAREQFDAYRARLAESTAQQAAPAGGRSAQGAIEAGKAPQAATPATRDELKLSRPGKGGAGGTAGRTGGSEEAQIAQGKAQAEAQGRVNELQKNVADLQKLLAMKNQAVANLEQQAATASGATAQEKTAKPAGGTTTAAAAAAKTATNSANGNGTNETDAGVRADSAAATGVAASGAAVTEAAVAASAASASTAASEAAAAVAVPASDVVATTSASAAVAPAKPAPNGAMNWRAVSQNPYVLPGAGALVVLLGLWALLRRRRAAAPVGQPGPYDDGRDMPDDHEGHDVPHDGAPGATQASDGVAVAAAGAAGAAALYAANQAQAEARQPAADDAWSASDEGVAAVHAIQHESAVDEAGGPDAWNAEPVALNDESVDEHDEGRDVLPVSSASVASSEAVAEPFVGDATAPSQETPAEAASEPEIDWGAAFAEEAGKAAGDSHEAPAAHDDSAAATLSALEALGAAAAVGGAAATSVSAPESNISAPAEPVDASLDGSVAGMLGDLDLAIPGQAAHVGTISSDALPSLSKGMGSVQFKMAPMDDPLRSHASADEEAFDEPDGELSDADFDAAMQQASHSPVASRSYTDTAHEAPSLKPLSFDLSDFSLDLKGDDAQASPAFVSAPTLATDIGTEALIEHEVLHAPAPETPYAAEPAAPQVPQSVAPVPAVPASPVAAASVEPGVPDEYHTKLELATAYQTIGDDEGARELLEEVIAGGDAAQQSVARTRLAELGK